ncbi:hypothetical protein HDU97_009475, partial [Phlyctochytrium planicorne]
AMSSAQSNEQASLGGGPISRPNRVSSIAPSNGLTSPAGAPLSRPNPDSPVNIEISGHN